MLDKCIFWCISYYLIFHRHGGLRHPPLLPWLVNSKILEIIPDNSFNLLLHSDSYHRLTPSLASHVYENNIQTTQYFLFLKDNTILFQNHISATTWHKYHEGIALRLITTPSFPVYKAWWNMTRSSKQHFDHLFIIYYITFDYKLIIIVNYVWLWIQSYEICIIKIKI